MYGYSIIKRQTHTGNRDDARKAIKNVFITNKQ